MSLCTWIHRRDGEDFEKPIVGKADEKCKHKRTEKVGHQCTSLGNFLLLRKMSVDRKMRAGWVNRVG